MNEENKINETEQIKKLLEQNLEYSKEIYRLTKKIKNYINFQKVMSIIYLLLIVVPIVLGIFYLPPLVKGIYSQYKDILGLPADGAIQDLLKDSAGKLDLNNIDINKLPPEVKKLLNK